MTSGSKIGTLLLALALPLCAEASTPATLGDAHALIASLARPAPARTPFAEARFMKMLDQPLVLSGELGWLGGDKLERRVDKPQRETSTIADGEVTQTREGRSPRTFSLKRAPQLQVLVDSFVALLGGDASRLDRAFTLEHSGDGARWTLVLTPRDAKVAGAVASIAIDGRGDEARCMRMQEADGDLSIDLLGPLAAQMPAAPTREGLLALCQAPN
ncbi:MULTISPECIES: LolA-related protein [Dyella]|uniref:LolA-related protein n=1 Tax=Dyella TaxID=231454 RepID=UPI0013F15600|nr:MULTISPECIES: LolA-related protein [Dyella]